MLLRPKDRHGSMALLFSLLLLSSCGGGGGGKGSSVFRVLEILPVDAALNVSVNLIVEVRFSHEVDPTTLQSGITFTLTELTAPGMPLVGAFASNMTGRVITFSPLLPLAISTDHRLTLTEGILDTRGRPLDLARSEVPIPSTLQTQTMADTSPPLFGGASQAVAIDDTSLEVRWAPAMDDIDLPSGISYNVYTSPTPGGQVFSMPDATSPPGATSQTVGGLQPATTYFLVVRAQDSSGNEESNFVEVSVMTLATPDTIPPVFMGVGSATVLNTSSVRLDWTAAMDNKAAAAEIVYNIYNATTPGGQSFANPISSTLPGDLSHTVGGLFFDTDYYFVVLAMDPSGNEDWNGIEMRARTHVSFGAQVQPIFTATCATSFCHAGPTPAQGLNLSSYAQISSTAISVAANQAPLDRIEPFISTASYLINKIDGTQGLVGGSGGQMPAGSAPPLSQADRDLIRFWVDQGAQSN
ncbi:MAG: Ig-like domain-containing protein [Planctomycetota bacterium]|nr:Ig-like domain-containing protein [Planctomycetota bacterium]